MRKWKEVMVYSDGACKNTGVGGFAAIIVQGIEHWVRPVVETDTIGITRGGELNTTNQRMELRGALHGLHMAAGFRAKSILLVSDSEYVIKGLRDWREGWKARGWVTASGQPVANLDLWKALDRNVSLIEAYAEIRYQHVRGHCGIPYNEYADQVATRQLQRVQDGLIEPIPQDYYPVLENSYPKERL